MIPFQRWMPRPNRPLLTPFKQERKDKTTIIVSHRLSAVHQADWIIVLDQGQIVKKVELVIYWLKRAGIMNNTNGNKNRKENKMKVLKRLLSRITLYPTGFLAGFICLLLATIFLNCLLFFSKDDRWAFDCTDPRWRARDLLQMGGFYLLVLSIGQLISYLGNRILLHGSNQVTANLRDQAFQVMQGCLFLILMISRLERSQQELSMIRRPCGPSFITLV